MSVYAPLADYFWDVLKSRDIDPRPVFESAGIRPDSRTRPEERIPNENIDLLIDRVAEVTNDVAIGVRAAHVFHPSHIGALGYAWLTSETLDQALGRFHDYARMTAQTLVLEHVLADGELRVRYAWTGPDPDNPAKNFTSTALLLRLSQLIVGLELRPKRLEFRPEAPGDIAAFDERFACPVKFGSNNNLLVFDSTLARRKLPKAHAALAQLNVDFLDRYLADLDRSDVVSRVRTEIIELLPGSGGRPEGRVTLELVADRLNMSESKLKRDLQAEGHTFKQLLTEKQREIALSAIKNPRKQLNDISYDLGFSEQSSFSRWFGREFGVSPSKFRASKLEPAATAHTIT